MSRCTFLNDELFPSLFFNLDLRRLDPTVAAEIEAEYLASEQASGSASLVTASATLTRSQLPLSLIRPPQASTVSEADSDTFSGSTLTLCPGRPKSPTSSVVSPAVKLTPKRRLSAAKVETPSSGKSTLSIQAERPNPPSSSAGSAGDIVTSRRGHTGPSVSARLSRASSLKQFMMKLLPDYSPGATRPLSLVIPKQVASSEIVPQSPRHHSWSNFVKAVEV